MATYKFNAAQRYAVYTAHGERCWLCGDPLSLVDMEVDHVIPETLLGTTLLDEVLDSFGLSCAFDLNSFSNWRPAHRRCNGQKGGRVFRPTPLIQAKLEENLEKAQRCEELAERYASDRRIANAINVICAANEQGQLSDEQKTALQRATEFLFIVHEENREPTERGRALFLTPGLEILQKDRNWITLRGPGGMVGNRPNVENPHPSWNCPRCGVTGWNGARCIVCGMLDDGD